MTQTTDIMTYNKWDVVLVPFPFSDLSAIKKRPALIVSPNIYNDGNDIIIAFITTNIPERLKAGDYKVEFWKEAGLISSSLLRMKFATITKKIILKKLGILHNPDQVKFQKELISFFNS